MSPAIAVIVPFFNASDTLPQLVEALKAQSYPNFIALFVDDGSTDNGHAYIDGIATADSRFRVLTGSHAGPGPARNIGLDEAEKSGVEYVTFVDADDLPLSTMLAEAKEALESSGADIAHYQWSSTVGGTPHKDSTKGTPSIYVWNKLYRRSAIGDIRFIAAKFAEDLAFFLETEVKSPKRITIDKPLYVHLTRAGSLWETRKAVDVISSIQIVVERIDTIIASDTTNDDFRSNWYSHYLPKLLKMWRKSILRLGRMSRRSANMSYVQYAYNLHLPSLSAFGLRLNRILFRLRFVQLYALREKFRQLKWMAKVRLIRRNYTAQVRRVSEKIACGEKIKVVFIVSECAKWKTQSLYDRMSASSIFEPLIAITAYGDWRHIPSREDEVNRSRRFSEAHGMRYMVVSDFSTGKQISLNELNPDIVFYDQPWELNKGYMPASVSRYALTAYVPYFVPTHADRPAHYALDFFKGLFLYVQLNELWCERFRRLMAPNLFAGRLVGLGHTALDEYWLHRKEACERRYVIYAPHWAFNHPNNSNELNISTFLWSGRNVLEYAKMHPDIDWVFKPHPRLRQALTGSGAWTQAEVDAYYHEWELIGTCRLDADYIGLFRNSKAMITDCSSFLAEYPPSGGAMIHLRSKDEKLALHELNMELYKTFYQVWDVETLPQVLDAVLVRNEDPNREKRMAMVRRLGLGENFAADNIMHYLENIK